jgi:hypothetical protein
VALEGSTAAPVEANVDVDVAALMKEVASWVAKGFNAWTVEKKNEVQLAIPHVVQDPLALANIKEVIAEDLRNILPLEDKIRSNNFLPPEKRVAAPAERQRRELSERLRI